VHPEGGEKKFRRNLQRKFVSALPSTPSAPPGRAESIFRIFLLGGGDLEAYLVDLGRQLL